ncbi:MAG: histidinol-phosphate transaminase [Coprobacillaceae bacterium]
MSWKDKLRDVEPYIAGEQPKIQNMIKLNTNENPYGPTPKVKEVLESIDSNMLRLYPNADAEELKTALSKYYDVKEEQIFIGNGSDEVLALAFLTFFNGKDPLLFPDITYSFYPVYCQLYNIDYELITLDNDFTMTKESFRKLNTGIIFPNPNAPTGILVGLEFIEDVLQHNPDSIVVIDEAYISFGGTSAVSLLSKYDNLVIIQTFSKDRSLAGIRLGVALGNGEAISKLYDVKNSFNSYPVDYVAQKVGVASVLDQDYFEQQSQKIIKTREIFKKDLKELGFIVPDSYANFVFVKHPNIDANEIFKALREVGIIVRHWNKDKINQYLRITIGTDAQMKQVITFLKGYIKKV